MPYVVMIVDDEASYRKIIRSLLESKGGYEVVEASSGDEALGILRSPNDVDVVLLDVMMPNMSGNEALKKIKNMHPEVAVIMLTGCSDVDTAIESLKGRADDFISKSMERGKLLAAVACAIRSKNRDDEVDTLDRNGKIAHVRRFIEKNYQRNVNLIDAAKVVGLSPKYLSRTFKEEAGMTFNDYKAMIKMSKAKEWLKSTGYNVSQITEKLGYLNIESFIRTFKRHAGCTPLVYRKTLR